VIRKAITLQHYLKTIFMKKRSSILVQIFFMLLGTLHTMAQLNPAAKKILGSSPVTANMQTMEVRIDDINEWLCPTAVLRGDREFNGNGPEIKVEVKLRIDNDKAKLFADIYFWAKETKHDWSTTEGTWTRLVYQAPIGKEIAEIVSEKISRTAYTSSRGGAAGEIGGLVSDGVVFGVRVRDDWYDVGPPAEGKLVKTFYIKSDTPGDDISTDDNCDGDTKIAKIEFNPVKVRLTNKQ
jgi:hypothetical protein